MTSAITLGISFLFLLSATAFGAPVEKTPQQIAYAQFVDLQIGWTREQIAEHLNNHPSKTHQTAAGDEYVDYSSPYYQISLQLVNNRLRKKLQYGLNKNKYLITKSQYASITVGMTRKDVASLVGSEGRLFIEGYLTPEDTMISQLIEYDSDQTTLLWWADVELVFSDGKVSSKRLTGMP